MTTNSKKVLEPGVKPAPIGPDTPGFHDLLCRVCGTSINTHQIPQLVSCMREHRQRLEIMRLVAEVSGNLLQARAELAMYRKPGPAPKVDDLVNPPVPVSTFGGAANLRLKEGKSKGRKGKK